jgi:hypothetical protein
MEHLASTIFKSVGPGPDEHVFPELTYDIYTLRHLTLTGAIACTLAEPTTGVFHAKTHTNTYIAAATTISRNQLV